MKKIKTINDMSIYDVEVNDSNLQDMLDIMKIIDSDGWKILEKHFNSARELVVEEQKLNIFRDDEVQHKSRTAILEGFDRFLALPLQIKNGVQEYLRIKHEEELEDARTRIDAGVE